MCVALSPGGVARRELARAKTVADLIARPLPAERDARAEAVAPVNTWTRDYLPAEQAGQFRDMIIH